MNKPVRYMRPRQEVKIRPEPSFRWSDERTTEMLRLWAKGDTAKDIAKAFGVTRNAVIGRLNRLGRMGDRTAAATRLGGKRTRVGWKPPTPVRLVDRARISAPKPDDEPHVPGEPSMLRTLARMEGDPPPDAVRFHALDRSGCQWPVGRTEDEDWFCGHRRIDVGESYCAVHRRRAWAGPARKPRPDKPETGGGSTDYRFSHDARWKG